MPAIFRTDSGIFGDIQANNMVVTGEIKVGETQQPINTYITQEINTVVGDGVDYSSEISSLSGQISGVSGYATGLAYTVGLTTGDINSLSGVVSGILENPTSAQGVSDSAFSGLSGYTTGLAHTVGLATGDINSLSGVVSGILQEEKDDNSAFSGLSGYTTGLAHTVGLATGDINSLSGVVSGILKEEKDDNTAFSGLSGYTTGLSGIVHDATGDINTLSGQITGITGDVSEISGFLNDLDTSAHYSDTDVSIYLSGNLDTHILPNTNETYDIGSADKKIRHLYLSSNSLYIGGEEGTIGTAISATAEGGIVLPSELNVSGINISGAIGGVQPTGENDSIQWNESEKKWVAGDKLSTTVDTLNITTGDLYSFYKKDNSNITNVSANLTALNFQPTTIPTTKTFAGTKGEITYDENYVYLCVADNTWKRLPSADF
jgi:hypothetical protein